MIRAMKARTVLALAAVVLVGGCAVAGREGGGAATRPEPTPAEREAAVLSNVTQLTFARDFDRAGEAYFSPDMRWVVFQAVPRGEKNYAMYVARLVRVGGEPAGLVVVTRVSPPGSRNTCGWFADDGTTLVFASTAGKDDPDEAAPGYQREGRNYRWAFSKGMEIYRVPGFEKRVLTSTEGFVDLARPEFRLTDNDAYDAECATSPDGEWVVFCSDRESVVEGDLPATQPAAARPRQLWAMRKDGSGLVQLTRTHGYNGGPFFSPDGKRLVYRSDRVGNDLLQVLVADVVRDRRGNITGLANERKVTDDANVNWGPYWSADGRRIVYASSKEGHANYELFSRRGDGSAGRATDRREARLTWSAGPDVLPVVSPDGNYLMWSSRRGEDKTTQVYVARLTWPRGS